MARRELHIMASSIPYMSMCFSTPAALTVFASDAQGAGETSAADCGGYGIVAADVTEKLINQVWSSSFAPGRCVAKRDGQLGKNWGSRANLVPTVPFAQLPAELIEARWEVLDAERWRIADHITLGEGRAHVRIFQALSGVAGAHGRRVIALEDNNAVSCSMTKGRSTAPALNYLIRRRSAALIGSDMVAACPWLQTHLMPADGASRGLDRAAPSGSAHCCSSSGLHQ